MSIVKILEKYDLSKREADLDKVIMEVESMIKHSLPDDYKVYCVTYGEIELDINEQIVLLFDVHTLMEVNSDYEVLEYCPEILIIGSNASGEGIAIDYKDQTPRIVLVPLIGMEREDFIEIGDSFTDLFERLEKGQSWFS